MKLATDLQRFVSSTFGMVKLVWQARSGAFIGILLLTTFQGIAPLAAAWLTKVLFDLLAQGLRRDLAASFPRDLLLLLIAQTILSVMSQMNNPVINHLDIELGRRLTVSVQSIIYRKINSLMGIAHFETPRFYDTIRLGEQSASYSPRNSLNAFTSLLRNSITLVGFLGILISFNPLLVGLVGLAAFPQFYAELKMGHQRFGLAFDNSPKERRLFYFGTLLAGIPSAKEVRLFDLGDYFLDKLLQTHQEMHQAQCAQELRELRWQLFLSVLSSLVASGAFIVVVIQAFSGHLSLGDIALYLSAVKSVQDNLGGIIFALSRLNESVLFYTHFKNLLAMPQSLPLASRVRPVPKLEAGIEFRNVSFRYSEQHSWVLHGINLSIPAGRCVALVGLNGAGKTTLIKLLMRFYDPTEGQILWDGIDIREFDPREMRHHISAVFQDFQQYELAAWENIGLGDVKHVDDFVRIRQAAINAGVHTVIEGLLQGYQTILSYQFTDGGSGTDLSRGEWQKLALARMLMRSADLLILDEPTAALDAQAEYEIYGRFAQVVTGRTSVLISHRFSTVRMADVIAVLKDGRIIECDSHDELVSRGGDYAKFYNMQAERYRC